MRGDGGEAALINREPPGEGDFADGRTTHRFGRLHLRALHGGVSHHHAVRVVARGVAARSRLVGADQVHPTDGTAAGLILSHRRVHGARPGVGLGGCGGRVCVIRGGTGCIGRCGAAKEQGTQQQSGGQEGGADEDVSCCRHGVGSVVRERVGARQRRGTCLATCSPGLGSVSIAFASQGAGDASGTDSGRHRVPGYGFP